MTNTSRTATHAVAAPTSSPIYYPIDTAEATARQTTAAEIPPTPMERDLTKYYLAVKVTHPI
jgi:hypothetical protein